MGHFVLGVWVGRCGVVAGLSTRVDTMAGLFDSGAGLFDSGGFPALGPGSFRHVQGLQSPSQSHSSISVATSSQRVSVAWSVLG